MTDKTRDTKEALKPFVRKDGFGSTKEVAIAGGYAYATDGRVAVKVKIDEGQPDDLPKDFPLKSLTDIVEDAKSKANLRYKLSRDRIASYIEDYKADFKKWMQKEQRDRRQWRLDLEEATCPCCGASLYIDGDRLLTEDELDEEEEEYSIKPEWHEWPVLLRLGRAEGDMAHFQFRFIKDLLDLSPEWKVGGVDRNEDGTIKMLYGESADGEKQFVMMPLWLDRYTKMKCVKAVIYCKEAEG